jgi:hypothetical protein
MQGIGLYQLKEKIQKIQKELSTLQGLVTKMMTENGEKDPATEQRELIARYCEVFKARWNVNPTLDGKSIGAMQRILKDHGLARAKILIEAYMKMSDPFFIKKRHDLATLSQNITTVGHFADTGQTVTTQQTRSMERNQKHMDLFNQINENKL